jgi:protein TonB
MHRLFAELVVSREARMARGGRFALTASLAIHAAAVLAVVLVPLLTTETPGAEPRRASIPEVIVIPPPALHPGPPSPPKVRRPAKPSMAVPREGPSMPAPAEIDLDAPDTLPHLLGELPCLAGCRPDGTAGGDPDGVGTGNGAPAPPRLLRADVDIRPPVKVRHVLPVYPDIARATRVQGTVVLDCTIDREGRVAEVKVLSGPRLLTTAALEAVRQWTYRPTLLDGVPVPVIMTVTVRFTLDARR